MTHSTLRPAGAVLLLFLFATTAQAKDAEKKKAFSVCVFDLGGRSGDFFSNMEDLRTAALDWGVKLELKVYIDEKTASEDLKAGKCDAALLTGTRARPFNRFPGTIEAVGGLPSYEHLRMTIELLASPKLDKKMGSDKYDTVAVLPAGAVYMYLRDRSLGTVEGMAGKRIATMDYDTASITMVNRIGASVVGAEIAQIAGLFNNGSVDACYAPGLAYSVLELHKGLGTKGAVLRLPLGQLTQQVITRKDAGFPKDFAGKARKWAAAQFDRALEMQLKHERKIPARYWLDPTPKELARYEDLFRDSRILLRENGTYDKTMLSLLRRVRCKKNPAHPECAEKRE